MTPQFTTPDVFVTELGALAPQIEGAPTGVAAFVGTASSGPLGAAKAVAGLRSFETEFGSGRSDSTLGPAIRDYFANCGRRAWIVRVDEVSRASVEAALATLAAEDEWDILCIPAVAGPATPKGAIARSEVVSTAIEFCERHKRFMIVDSPAEWHDVQSALNGRAPLGQSPNAAVYFPWLVVPSSGARAQRQSDPPSGAIAGVYARNDAARGVWKAPAGTEAGLVGVTDLALSLGDADLDLLNPEGINALRSFQQIGPVVWGGRTLATGASEWRYVSVRRTVLFLERSIDRGTQWTVFEPNDEPLWTSLRASVESFLDGLFRQGAFAGSTRSESFFVRCGRDTTTQADIDLGRLNLEVGVAPLKPAEFVIVKFTLSTAGQATNPAPASASRRGTLVVFVGPRGSGQQRAANRLAREQGRTLHRVHSRQILGKYIGETEKNLDQIFAQASKNDWVLFFDEADALFGKRTDVKDSHDRFANIEVSYLLKRTKRFAGTVIVAMPSPDETPRKLRRRCDHCIEFPVGA